MKRGTKSLLFGVHQVFLHPLLVALAWWRLYDFRRVECPASGLRVSLLDPRLWLVLLVHDWGYWGCETMDGEDGKQHPIFGALMVRAVVDQGDPFDATRAGLRVLTGRSTPRGSFLSRQIATTTRHRWSLLALLHSRSMARRVDLPPSILCAPDKLAVCMYPRWLYLLLARASGELWEYIGHADTPAGRSLGLDASSPERWYDTCSAYMREVCFRIVEGGPAGVPPEDIWVDTDKTESGA